MSPSPSRLTSSRLRWIALGLAVVLVGASVVVVTGLLSGGNKVVRVEIAPAGVLLTSAGETRPLAAQAFDSAGRRIDAQVRWASSRSGTVEVNSQGTVTARSVGSAQLVAEADGVKSAPILVVVATPGAGVRLLTDDQIVGDPVEVDPTVVPDQLDTFRAVLRDPAPAVGDLILGAGAKPLAGRVVKVEPAGGQATVTVRLVPLPQLLPNLRIEERLDLSNGPVLIRPEIARLYDVVRTGDAFQFTPKPNFKALVAVGPRSGPLLASLDGAPVLSRPDPEAGAVGTIATLPPFGECTGEGTFAPFAFSEPASFTLELSPVYDIAWTEATGFERAIVTAQPVGKAKLQFDVATAFETKYTCEGVVLDVPLPLPGALAPFLGGVVTAGIGFELGGKMTVASMTLGAEVSATAALQVGIECPGGGECSFRRSLGPLTVAAAPIAEWPSLASNLRLEPSLEVYAFVGLEAGSLQVRAWRIKAAKAKLGAKLAGNWAPRIAQIETAGYESDYKLTAEAGAKVEAGIGAFARRLGIGAIAALELAASVLIARSPTGTLVADRPTYQNDDPVRVTVTLDAATLAFLGADQVERILLVRHSGGRETILDRKTAASGQRTFEFSFTAQGPVTQTELYAFVVTRVAPLDAAALELGRAPAPSARPSGSPSARPSGSPSASPSGSPSASPSGGTIFLGGAVSRRWHEDSAPGVSQDTVLSATVKLKVTRLPSRNLEVIVTDASGTGTHTWVYATWFPTTGCNRPPEVDTGTVIGGSMPALSLDPPAPVAVLSLTVKGTKTTTYCSNTIPTITQAFEGTLRGGVLSGTPVFSNGALIAIDFNTTTTTAGGTLVQTGRLTIVP